MLGQMVRAYRRRQGLSQEALAEAVGLSVRGIRKIEAGNTDAPRPATVRLLADALKLTGAERDRFVSAAAGGSAISDTTFPRQLPADIDGFTGRIAQLDDLDAMLPGAGNRPPAVVISAIGGTAGVGKTALAVHWAHQVADEFPDGQLYVNLRGFDPGGRVMPPAEAVRGFLDALGVPAERIPADLDSQAALYRSTLADRRVLVLLDNARDAEQVRPLLPGTPTTLVLVTSRNQLTPLVAAEGARPLNLDLLSTEEARELLARRLGADRVAAEPEAVDAIIDACARLPLALAIAAAHAEQPGFPLATLAAELRDEGKRLDTLDAGDPASQVRAVFSWSYAALTPVAARLFRVLGLHPGPEISVAAGASLAGCQPAQARRLLAELVRASLLTEHIPCRYTWHDLLRAYATERAEAEETDPDRHAALTRLLDHYIHTAHAADRLLNPKRPPIRMPIADPAATVSVEHLHGYEDALDWLGTEYPCLRTALRHAADRGFDTHAWQLAWTLQTFQRCRGYWHHQVTVWRIALASARRLGDQTAQALAYLYLGGTLVDLGRYGDARRQLARGQELFDRLGDQPGQAHIHNVLAIALGRQNRLQQAVHHAQEALALFRALGDRQGEGSALNNLGWYSSIRGDHIQAAAYCEQALALFQRLGDQHQEACAWDSLGVAHHHLGNHARAADCHRAAIALRSQLGDRYNEAVSLHHLGDTQHAAGDPEAAREAWQEALDILTDLDHPDADSVRSKLDSLRS